MHSSSQCLSRDLLENELVKYSERSSSRVQYTERDRRLVSAYRSFVRFNVIRQKRELLLDDYIFTTLAKYLCANPKLSYDEFKVISGVAPPAAKKYFSAKCFLKFPKDETQCINSEDFVRFIERSIEVENIMLNLMDVVAPGSDPLLTSLTEQQLEVFLMKMIPEVDVLQRMHESFYDYYAYTASQKFLFFLDGRRTNSIPIKKIAHSKEMEELLQLRKLALQANELGLSEVEAQLNKNWFSDSNAVRLYSLFLELDRDQNGTLSMDEVAEFAGLNRRKRINFTAVAWGRIFEEFIPYSPQELDYKAFVNLVLALENPTSPASIKYFWKILDFDRSGRLTPMKIKYFYNAVHASLIGNYDAPCAAHVVVEVYDLLACNDPQGATLDDMLKSQQGHVVITMLLDVNGFWRYDNRESLVGGDEDDDGPAEQYVSTSNAPQLGAHSGSQSSLQVQTESDALDTLLGGSGGLSAPVHSPRPGAASSGGSFTPQQNAEERAREEAAYRATHEVNIHLPTDHTSSSHISSSTSTSTTASTGSSGYGSSGYGANNSYGKNTSSSNNKEAAKRIISQIDEEYEDSKYTDASFEDFEDDDE